jgi:hypothetical protein
MLRLLPILILLGIAGAGVAAHELHSPPPPTGVQMVASTKGFRLSGLPVRGLYPGVTRPMTVKIKNPYAFSIKVPKVKAKVASTTSVPGCGGVAANLRVKAPKGALVIPKRRTKSLVLQIVMPSTVANACQGAAFRITVSARAKKA